MTIETMQCVEQLTFQSLARGGRPLSNYNFIFIRIKSLEIAYNTLLIRIHFRQSSKTRSAVAFGPTCAFKQVLLRQSKRVREKNLSNN